MSPPGQRDEVAVAALMRWFTPRTGAWQMPAGQGWQPSVALEAVINLYERTRDVSCLNVVERSFARYRGRRSAYVDDNGWFLNTWLRVYDVTGDEKYLDEAVALFAVLALAWDTTYGGGLWWHRERDDKFALTNELFLLAAARLHRRAPGRSHVGSYLGWARRTWDWFDTSEMIDGAGLVRDAVSATGTHGAVSALAHDAASTCNQGVILGALAELWRATGEDELLARADAIAGAALSGMVYPGGILREPGEPDSCDGDQQIFKGIFAQGLARLHQVDPARTPHFGQALAVNADAAWDARDVENRVTLGWHRDEPGPGGPSAGVRAVTGPVTAATHASATLLLTAVAVLHEGGEITQPRAGARAVVSVDAAVLGDLDLESQHVGFTGGGYVAHWFTDGQYVTFMLDEPVARRATLTLRYAAGAGDAYRYLEVNGIGRADRLLFAATAGWRAYATVSYDVALRGGENTVSLIYDSSRGSSNPLNLDCLRVSG